MDGFSSQLCLVYQASERLGPGFLPMKNPPISDHPKNEEDSIGQPSRTPSGPHLDALGGYKNISNIQIHKYPENYNALFGLVIQ